MEQKWMQLLVILVFYQRINTGACEERVKQGQPYEITCRLQKSVSTYFWFRVLDTHAMEFIASYGINGIKTQSSTFSSFSHRTSGTIFILTLNSFDKTRDSGVYGCAFQKQSKLEFDGVTRLVGEKDEVQKEAPVATIEPTPCTTAIPCVCDKTREQGETNPSMLCSPIILGPLAGSCGLLLLLLIITTLYCNKIRTRRCPHHYKRKPRPMPPGKQMMTNRRT
ncbi:T-cell surface glycoprotein CD8 alpha chain-like [Cheilinus undulatus]|uniref:T-cell surface glycoprotein CD8 alpha chain-like n=1 Tax=Cheilinus undulatus TaxID=241271 RepID=UPI001BD4E738|nr:T-cell surface glycoprotein CD8 alpha chain-like [Cheilinus undulatus]XP_041673290.1 T-cell surface glycoprotein CD8 alpha chain-like [Cheilinus undulatus]